MPTLSDKQALDFLSRLFPAGLKDPDLLAEVCPEGWEASPLRQAFHPTPEQRYQEHLGWLRSPIHALSRKKQQAEAKPESVPTFEEFLAKKSSPSRHHLPAEDEWPELLGACLWDILSDNHELVDETDATIDFGSFRMVSGLIDQFIEGVSLSDGWGWGDHMHFYMGTSMIPDRADLSPVYRLIFRRIRKLGYEWKYSFPRIYMVRFRKETGDPTRYDPSKAFAEEEKRKAEDEEDHKQREAMARDLAEAKHQALDTAPPSVVLAYQEVFGKDPHGWPPDPDSTD